MSCYFASTSCERETFEIWLYCKFVANVKLLLYELLIEQQQLCSITTNQWRDKGINTENGVFLEKHKFKN